jgi:hypothetical protein
MAWIMGFVLVRGVDGFEGVRNMVECGRWG